MTDHPNHEADRPPIYDEGEAPPIEQGLHAPLATRVERLAAALIDFVLAMVVVVPGMYWLGAFDDLSSAREESLVEAAAGLVGSFASFVAMHGYLLAKSAQTIGKRLLKIRVVNVSDGEPTPFWTLVALRQLPQQLLILVPVVGVWFSLVEVLFIARADLRTGHDLWSGTRVVKVAS